MRPPRPRADGSEPGSTEAELAEADLFVGVWAPGLPGRECVARMNRDPIAFETSNPVPEVMPEESKGMDDRLLKRASSGDGDALAGLYDRHATRVFRTALLTTGNREDAKDVTQEVFLRLLKGAGKIRDLPWFPGEGDIAIGVEAVGVRHLSGDRRFRPNPDPGTV